MGAVSIRLMPAPIAVSRAASHSFSLISFQGQPPKTQVPRPMGVTSRLVFPNFRFSISSRGGSPRKFFNGLFFDLFEFAGEFFEFFFPLFVGGFSFDLFEI